MQKACCYSKPFFICVPGKSNFINHSSWKLNFGHSLIGYIILDIIAKILNYGFCYPLKLVFTFMNTYSQKYLFSLQMIVSNIKEKPNE